MNTNGTTTTTTTTTRGPIPAGSVGNTRFQRWADQADGTCTAVYGGTGVEVTARQDGTGWTAEAADFHPWADITARYTGTGRTRRAAALAAAETAMAARQRP